MRALLVLLREELRRNLIVKLRYPSEVLGSILVLGVVYGLTHFTTGVGTVGSSTTPTTLLPAIAAWIMLVSSASRFARFADEEASGSAGEYIFMSTLPHWGIFTLKYLVESLLFLLLTFLAFVGAYWSILQGATVGMQLLIGMIAYELSLIGLGLAILGASLRYKKLTSLLAGLYLVALFGLINGAQAVKNMQAVAYLPILSSASLLLEPASFKDSSRVLLSLITAAFAMSIGLWFYAVFVRSAQKSGSLSLH